MMFGTEFDGQHSHRDYGFRVIDRQIGLPDKIKVLERIPHSNRVFDYSTIYGGQEYTERQLTYTYRYFDTDKIELDRAMTAFVNHLCRPSSQVILRDDHMPGLYFRAEVRNGPLDIEKRFSKEITVTYTAYPFRIFDNHGGGNDIWDDFNFLTDSFQETEFVINSPNWTQWQEIRLNNPSIATIRPTLRLLSGSVRLVRTRNDRSPLSGGITEDIALALGDNANHNILLFPGDNVIWAQGMGSVKIEWFNEVI